jgi:hypothetical protein
MAFLNEIIPEEQKDKFTFPVETNRDGSKPTLYKWTVDFERNIFLVMTKHGGGAHQGVPRTEWYVLSWNGEVINFQCEPEYSGDFSTGQNLLLKIKQLTIPLDLQIRKEEIIQLIKDILDAKSWPYKRSAYIVTVEFDQ